MHIFHDWSKWEPYEASMREYYAWGKLAGQSVDFKQERQTRTCNKCGKKQDEPIYGA